MRLINNKISSKTAFSFVCFGFIIEFLLHHFGFCQLDELKAACLEKPTVSGNEWKASSGADFVQIFGKSQHNADQAFEALKTKLGKLKTDVDFEKASSVHNEDSIPAATLRELFPSTMCHCSKRPNYAGHSQLSKVPR